MKWMLWAIPLAIITFLWALNEQLHGRSKETIGGLLSFLILGDVAAAFAISGWKLGLVSLVGAFCLASLLRLPARAVARRLLPSRGLGLGQAPLAREPLAPAESERSQTLDRYESVRSPRRAWSNRLLQVLGGSVVALVLLAILGKSIGTTAVMPDRAWVLVSDVKRQYYAPVCVSIPDSALRHAYTRADAEAILARYGFRAIRAGDAERLGYEPNADCRDRGAFMMDGRSMTGWALQSIGLLKPLPPRWNSDGTWNW